MTQLRKSCLERYELFCDFEIDVRVLLTLHVHTPPGRSVHRYISCFSDKLLIVRQKINLAIELGLGMHFNFKLKICELNPTTCILNLGFRRI